MTGYRQPPRRRTPEFHLHRKNTNFRRLADKYRAGQSWAAIGEEIGLSGPQVYRAVVQGRIPRSQDARRKLGLIRKPRPRLLRDMRREELAKAIRERG